MSADYLQRTPGWHKLCETVSAPLAQRLSFDLFKNFNHLHMRLTLENKLKITPEYQCIDKVKSTSSEQTVILESTFQ